MFLFGCFVHALILLFCGYSSAKVLVHIDLLSRLYTLFLLHYFDMWI